MENFDQTSSGRKEKVLDFRYRVMVIDRSDESKTMSFDCGTDLMFFLTFVDFDLYKVLIESNYSSGFFNNLDNLGNSCK